MTPFAFLGEESEPIDLLDFCLTLGMLNFNELSSASRGEHSINRFAETLSEHVNSQNLENATTIKQLTLAINKHQLQFSMKLPLKVRGYEVKTTIKGGGEVYLNRDRSEVVIKVSKVRAGGILPLTSAFFYALKGVGAGRMIVDQPYIRIKLSDH